VDKLPTKNIRGQLLMESMIGIGILIVGLLGILGLLSHSIGLNKVNGNRLVANYLASEGIEITKNIIDSNIIKRNPWNQGFDVSGVYEADYTSTAFELSRDRRILFDANSGFYGYQNGGQTPFIRTITISPSGPDQIYVKSSVRWTDRGGADFQVDLEDYFYNWRP